MSDATVAKRGKAAFARLESSPAVAEALRLLLERQIIREDRAQWLLGRCADAYAEFEPIKEPLRAQRERISGIARSMESLASALRAKGDLAEWLHVTDAAILAHIAHRARRDDLAQRFYGYAPIARVSLVRWLEGAADYLREYGIPFILEDMAAH